MAALVTSKKDEARRISLGNAISETALDVVEGGSVDVFGDHKHPADPSKLEIVAARNSLKRKAADSVASTSVIVSEVLRGTSALAVPGLPLVATMKRSVRLYRSAHVGPTPKSVSDFVIPEEYKRTLDGDNFLLVDDTMEDGGRIVVFGTEKNLDILRSCGFWMADGTFKVAPEIFYQIYTIHGLISGESIPLLFAFVPNKRKATYSYLCKRIFHRLSRDEVESGSTKPWCDVAPDVIVTDFEQAAIAAMNETFNGGIEPVMEQESTMLHGCYFHLWKNIREHVAESGYKRLYETNKVMFLFCLEQ